MSAKILDGKILAARLKEELRLEVQDYKIRYDKVPSLVSIVLSSDLATESYIQSQRKTAENIGIRYDHISLAKANNRNDVMRYIDEANGRSEINGIIINKPLPDHLDFHTLINAIRPEKDVEGLNTYNLGLLLSGKTSLIPCTPAAAIAHIKSIGIDLKGKEAVVLGRSDIVGKPMALLLLKENATVTMCHSATKDLSEHVKKADIVVAAIGRPLFVKGDWIKSGAIVIDVGINQVDGKIVGDVDFESAKAKAGYITPVPGGVGPVTSVMLVKNVVEAFKAQLHRVART